MLVVVEELGATEAVVEVVVVVEVVEPIAVVRMAELATRAEGLVAVGEAAVFGAVETTIAWVRHV